MSVFVFDRPVYGARFFYGRQMLMRGLDQALDGGRSIMVCGGPRTGRTSTLYQLMHRVHERWRRKPGGAKVVPVFMDLNDLKGATDAEAAQLVHTEIAAAIRDPLIAGKSPPPWPKKLTVERGQDPWQALEAHLVQYWQQIRGTAGWCTYGILIDNADRLFERGFEGVRDAIATLAQKGEDWAPCSLIAAGGRAAREHLLDKGASLGFMRPLFLGALKPSESQALLKKGLPKSSQSRLDSVIQATNSHPFLLQRIAAELASGGPSVELNAAVERAAGDCQYLFARLWQAFDLGRGVTYRGAYAAPEHSLMQLLIDFPQGCDLAQAESELGIKPLKEYAEFLEYAAVAAKSLDGNRTVYRASFGLWNRWYNARIMR